MPDKTGPARIIVLVPNLLGADGIATVARQALGALSRRAAGVQAELEVWSLHEVEPPRGADLPTFRLRIAGGNKCRFAGWGLREGLRDQSRTLVIAMHVALAPAALALAMRRAGLALFFHGVEVWRPLRRLETVAVRRARVLMANSEYTAGRFLESNPACAGLEVQVCRLGTPLPPMDADSGGMSERFALIVGRMAAEERYKGHDLLLELWPEIVEEVADARLVVVGDGDDRPRLQQKAGTLGLKNAVHFAGRVSAQQLKRLYRKCSFFIMPSRKEGFGLVFLEAMRFGKACVGAVGAAAEIIEHGVSGFVVDPDDRDRVCQAAVRLFREPELAARMGKAGAERVAALYTESHFRSRFLSLLGMEEGRP